MAGVTDRLRAVIRAALGLPRDPGAPPSLMHLPLCWAKVQTQNGDGTLELQPVDTRYPGVKNVPLSTPFPGAKVKVAPGALVVLAWAYGDPAQKFALPIWGAGATLVSLELGSSPDGVATKQDLTAIINALTNATCGGSGSPITFIPAFPLPTDYASTSVKVQR